MDAWVYLIAGGLLIQRVRKVYGKKEQALAANTACISFAILFESLKTQPILSVRLRDSAVLPVPQASRVERASDDFFVIGPSVCGVVPELLR